MPKFIEISGRTIEEAINTACEQLHKDRDSVSVEVIKTPSKGFLGMNFQPALVRVSYESDHSDKAVSFLESVLTKMGINPKIEADSVQNEIKINLSGADMGIVIGRRGETLDALQYLTALVVNKGEQEYIKVTIDTENYRKKREETLEKLARKLAGKVQKYRRNLTLEPMNPYERRIIHSTLQDMPNISTYSTGVEPNRKVVIAYNTGSKKEGAIEKTFSNNRYRSGDSQTVSNKDSKPFENNER